MLEMGVKQKRPLVYSLRGKWNYFASEHLPRPRYLLWPLSRFMSSREVNHNDTRLDTFPNLPEVTLENTPSCRISSALYRSANLILNSYNERLCLAISVVTRSLISEVMEWLTSPPTDGSLQTASIYSHLSLLYSHVYSWQWSARNTEVQLDLLFTYCSTPNQLHTDIRNII